MQVVHGDSSDVMHQMALRLPARLIDRLDFVVGHAQEHARKSCLPASFVNRSTIIREAIERGLGELLHALGIEPSARPVAVVAKANATRNQRARNAAESKRNPPLLRHAATKSGRAKS